MLSGRMVLRNALEMVNLDVVAIKEYCLFHLYRCLLSDTFHVARSYDRSCQLELYGENFSAV